MPASIPVIVPDASVVANIASALLQVPPVAASLNDVVAVAQTVAVPVIVPASGNGFTVTSIESTAVPQLLITV